MTVLTNFAFDPLLDLAPWVGQRQASFRFERYNSVTREIKGPVNPVRNNARLNHDTGRLIKRTLNLSFGVEDSAAINPVSDRIRVFMTFPNGAEYPMGTYMFTDESRQKFLGGDLTNVTLNDEMYIVDQPLVSGIDGNQISSINSESDTPQQVNIERILAVILEELKIQFIAESTSFGTVMAWPAGTRRGQAIESLSTAADYFSPWFDNNNKMRFIRSFNPAYKIPDFDWDRGNVVMRDNIVVNSNLLNAPNRFLVISTGSGNVVVDSEPSVGITTVPASAPHSFENRGFYITEQQSIQAVNKAQAQAMADNLANRLTIFETVTISTAPDPRHDSYNVIRWSGTNWLELSWSMALTEGAPMTHTLRKSYRNDQAASFINVFSTSGSE